MKTFFLYILILIGINCCYAQLEFVSERDIKTDNFFIDILGNEYLYSKKSLQKTDIQTNKIVVYDTKKYGTLTSIDISNPLSTLLFYEESNIIVFLDNYLAEQRSAINLDDLGLFGLSCVCNSHRGFWIFDNQQCNVNLISKDLNIIQKGTNLYSIIEINQPTRMLETNNFLVLQINNSKLIILDKFGNYYKSILTHNLSFFDVFNDDIFTIEDKKMKKYSLSDNNEFEFDLPQVADIQSFNIYKNYLFLLTKEKLIKYKF